MNRTTKFVALLSLFFAFRSMEPRALAAQVNSNTATVNLSMTVGESITVQPSVTTLPAFSYTAGASTSGTQSFTLTTTWQLAAGHTAFHSNFWFASATSAMTNGTTNIPASQFFLKVNAGSFSDCAHASDPVVTQAVNGASCNNGIVYPLVAPFSGNQTDNITVQLQGLAANLSAGNYTGVLNFAADAN